MEEQILKLCKRLNKFTLENLEILSEIAEELGEEPFWHIQETFNLIEKKLKENPKPIIIDEVDYLLERNTIETLRDLYDTTSCPLVLVGMGNIDKKLSRYPHIVDRIYKSFKFERYAGKSGRFSPLLCPADAVA